MNRKSFGEVSTNHIARKTGISIGTLYKYYPNKDAILADLSLKFMADDENFFSRVFEEFAQKRENIDGLINKLVEALITIHRQDAQVRGVVYQNLERLKLLGAARNATHSIHAKGSASFPEIDPVLTWIAISAINAAIHSMSQLPREQQRWDFVKVLVKSILEHLLNSQNPVPQ